MRHLLLVLLLTAVANAQNVAVKVVTDKTTYAIGDPMKIGVKSQITGYLILLWTDPTGVTRIAVPSPLSSYDRIYAGQTLQIRDSRGARLEQTGPAGTETLQAMITRNKVDIAPFVVDSQVTDPARLKDFLEKSGPFGQASVTYTVR